MQKSVLGSPSPYAGERRKFCRTAIGRQIYFATKQRIYQGTLCNLSPRGLFIETHERLSQGEMILGVLSSPETDDLKFKGRIVWCDRRGFGVKLQSSSV